MATEQSEFESKHENTGPTLVDASPSNYPSTGTTEGKKVRGKQLALIKLPELQ